MNDLLIGLLSALLSTNQAAVTGTLSRAKAAITAVAPRPADPVDAELKRIMDLDDQARGEVDDILIAAAKAKEKNPELKVLTTDDQVDKKLGPVRKAYEDFINQHPDHAKARVAFGSFLHEISEEDEGVRQWLKAKELDPKEPSVWNNLANHYGHVGPMTNALTHYARAIELSPYEALYYQNLATTMYLFRAQTAEFLNKTVPEVMDTAMVLYRRAVELDPENFELATDVAQSYYGMPGFKGGKTEAEKQQKLALTQTALLAWTNAFKLARDDIERQGVQIHFARLTAHVGRHQEAVAALLSVTNAMFDVTKRAIHRKITEETTPATNSPVATPSPQPKQP